MSKRIEIPPSKWSISPEDKIRFEANVERLFDLLKKECQECVLRMPCTGTDWKACPISRAMDHLNNISSLKSWGKKN